MSSTCTDRTESATFNIFPKIEEKISRKCAMKKTIYTPIYCSFLSMVWLFMASNTPLISVAHELFKQRYDDAHFEFIWDASPYFVPLTLQCKNKAMFKSEEFQSQCSFKARILSRIFELRFKVEHRQRQKSLRNCILHRGIFLLLRCILVA